jgi:hypothetical protein
MSKRSHTSVLVCFPHYLVITDVDDVQASDSSIDTLALLLSRCVRPSDSQLVSVTNATSSIYVRTLQLLQVYQHILTRQAQLSLIVANFRSICISFM